VTYRLKLRESQADFHVTLEENVASAAQISDEELFIPEEVLNPAEVAKMDQNLKRWVHSWDLEAESELSHLEEVITVNNHNQCKNTPYTPLEYQSC